MTLINRIITGVLRERERERERSKHSAQFNRLENTSVVTGVFLYIKKLDKVESKLN
jgi:hypothetical protein